MLDRNDTKKGGEFDRAVAVLTSETVLPDVDGTTWWTETLDDSVKHTVGVSKDLREGVRESIEIIANEVVRRRASAGLDPLPDSDANVLARQSLRYLYRILFLLYAEASPEMKVLPVGAPEYALGYGLDRLRELVLVELGEESRHRTHLYSSLAPFSDSWMPDTTPARNTRPTRPCARGSPSTRSTPTCSPSRRPR